jgi:SAM-dependent methyltransferase
LPVVRRLIRLLRRELDATPVGTFGVFAGNNRMIVTLPDGSPLICLADDRTLTPVLAAQGIHDLPYWRFLEKHLRPGDRVIEIGAGIGVFTTHIARRVGRFGSVVATESDPRNLEILRENLTCNKLIDRVTVRAGSLVNLSMDGSPAIPLGDLCRPDLPIHLLRIASQVHATRLLMELETLLKCGSVRRIAIEFGEATPDSERALLGTLIRRIATEGKFGFETLDDCGLPRVAPLGAASSTQGRRHHFFLTATNPQVPAS